MHIFTPFELDLFEIILEFFLWGFLVEWLIQSLSFVSLLYSQSYSLWEYLFQSILLKSVRSKNRIGVRMVFVGSCCVVCYPIAFDVYAFVD